MPQNKLLKPDKFFFPAGGEQDKILRRTHKRGECQKAAPPAQKT